MSIKEAVVAIFSLLIASSSWAEVEISGSPDELTKHLSNIPGRMTLSADAVKKVEADRVEITLKIENSDRHFKKALEANREIRSEAVSILKDKGVSADNIKMSGFSSVPAEGFFSSKTKSYNVSSLIVIDG